MNLKRLTVDFSKKCGRIKPLHGVSGGPRIGGARAFSDTAREFTEIAVPTVRLHDEEYPYGSNQFVDIHCIFPDFDLDPELPESYNFAPTDEYIKAIKDTGADIVFRLGESTDLFPRTLYTSAPKDFVKWAQICEHIILHYNEKWADGFKYNIKRFEIFGGADDSRVFSGEPEQFFELYRVTANYLRERFPKLKIGAYGSGGFYALNRLTSTEEQKKYVTFLRAFLKYISRSATEAPLDFLTWYCYPTVPEEITMHAKFSRTILDEYGFRRAASVVCYNTAAFMSDDISHTPAYVSELAALMICAQKSDAESGILTDSPKAISYGKSFFTRGGGAENCPIYHTLMIFSELHKLSGAAETVGDIRQELYSMAATNGEKHAVMIATRSFSGNMELKIAGAEISSCRIRRIKARSADTSEVSSAEGELAVKGDRVLFRLDKESVYLLTMN